MSKAVSGFRPGSKSWKNFMGKLYGLGAAVVIVGAMFKIQHWPGAGLMLVIGLSTEAVIFMFSAFEPPHEEPDWTLVYPELATGHDDLELDSLEEDNLAISGSSGSMTEHLDKMLEDAKIEPELIQSLGDGLRSLSSTAGKLNDVSDASVATEDYISNLQSAADRVGKLSDSYEKASESLMGMTSTTEEGASFGEQMVKVTNNLEALNNVYELQLKGSSEQLENMNKMYAGITDLMSNLENSVEDTRRYKENMEQLSKNLSALNTVYGNMLSAMNMTPQA